MSARDIRYEWIQLCNEYLQQFCHRHDYKYEPDMWVANDYGTIACVNDMYVTMEVIRYDVDNCIDTDCFESWYWKGLEVYELTGNRYMNYKAYTQGAPDIYTEEKLNSIREAKKRVDVAKELLQKEIEDLTKNETI